MAGRKKTYGEVLAEATDEMLVLAEKLFPGDRNKQALLEAYIDKFLEVKDIRERPGMHDPQDNPYAY